MKIIIKVDGLVKKINQSLLDYDEKYDKLLKLFLEKQENYVAYLKKKIAAERQKDKELYLKSPPYLPSWDRDRFVNVLAALEVHQEELVEMDDREYNEILRGMVRLDEETTESINSISSLSY